jgi:tRNA A37 threonylcarbamoyladenosine dehydratase
VLSDSLAIVESDDFDRRFGGLARLYGAKGATRIHRSHAVVVGIGGVGSWTAEAFARSGVSEMTLIDLDHIALSNVNRQIHATSETLGQAKVLAMRDRIASINPACKVQVIDDFLSPENLVATLDPLRAGLVDGKTLAIVDACDQVRTKVALAAWARGNPVTFISVGAAGGKRLAHRVDCADIGLITHDPLVAQMRYQLRRHHGAARTGHMGVQAVFSRETVSKSMVAGSVAGDLNCHGYGSTVAVTASFGMVAAGWCMDQIAGSTA